jgi:hypothetical protein
MYPLGISGKEVKIKASILKSETLARVTVTFFKMYALHRGEIPCRVKLLIIEHLLIIKHLPIFSSFINQIDNFPCHGPSQVKGYKCSLSIRSNIGR